MTTWYVATSGSDSYSGLSPTVAFKTFEAADNVLSPGDIVKVLPGTYTRSSTFISTKSGTSIAPIVWTTYIKKPWLNPGPSNNAVIAGGDVTLEFIQINLKGNYVFWVGFEFSDASASVGLDFWGQNCGAYNNYIHDMAGSVTDQNTPGAGVFDRGAVGAGYNEFAYNYIVRMGNINTTTVFNSVVHCVYVSGTHDFIHHNICISAPGYGVYSSGVTNTNDHMIVASNLCAEMGNSGIAFGCITAPPAVDFMYCINNMLINNGKPNTSSGFGVREVDGNTHTGLNSIYAYNLTYGNLNGDYHLQNGLTPINPIYGAPSFVNYQSDGTGDYHQVLGSPGIDNGNGLLPSWSTFNWSQDLDGNLVPLGVGWDTSPYEFIAPHGGVAIFDQTLGSAVFGGIAGGIEPFFLHGTSDNALTSQLSQMFAVYDSVESGTTQGQMWYGNTDPRTRIAVPSVQDGDLWINDNPTSTNQNSTVGPTSTPGSSANWYSGVGQQKYVQWFASLTGNIISISFYADGDGSNAATFYGCVWSTGGTLLGNTSSGSFSGGARRISGQHWHTLTGISVPVVSGTHYNIGWQNDNSHLVDWSCYSSLNPTWNTFGYNTQSTFPGNLGSTFTPAQPFPTGIYFVVQTSAGTQAHISLSRNGTWVTVIA